MSQPTKVSHESTVVEPVRFVNAGPFLLAGLRKHYDGNTRSEIPELWHEAGPQFGKLPSQAGDAYGICTSTSDNKDEFDYMAAIEVSNVKHLPAKWVHTKIPKQRYAVFPHHGPVSDLNDTVKEIFQSWLPNSDYEPVSGQGSPDFLEHYGKDYDPKTGTGHIEVWLPLGN